jgi:hypothetical protein
MRTGADYFIRPAGPSQRRYEALRAYFVDGMPAAEVADRFGYSTASVQTSHAAPSRRPVSIGPRRWTASR